jgi:DNA/RNA-binding domain of Phe-tRNA-synthetase-like protein
MYGRKTVQRRHRLPGNIIVNSSSEYKKSLFPYFMGTGTRINNSCGTTLLAAEKRPPHADANTSAAT